MYVTVDGHKKLFATLEYNNGVLQNKYNIVFRGHEKDVDLTDQLPKKSIRQEYLDYKQLSQN